MDELYHASPSEQSSVLCKRDPGTQVPRLDKARSAAALISVRAQKQDEPNCPMPRTPPHHKTTFPTRRSRCTGLDDEGPCCVSHPIGKARTIGRAEAEAEPRRRDDDPRRKQGLATSSRVIMSTSLLAAAGRRPSGPAQIRFAASRAGRPAALWGMRVERYLAEPICHDTRRRHERAETAKFDRV